jgi:hypothetical protein
MRKSKRGGNNHFHIPKSPIPSPKKIATRGLYEIMWGAEHRDYDKRVNGKKSKNS